MSDFTSRLIDLILRWFPTIFGFGLLVTFAVVIVIGIRQHLRERRKRIERAALAARMPYAVFARIPDPVLPMVRGRKYEEPLDQSLVSAKLGMVTGGGTQTDKNGKVAWVGLDIALADLEDALQFTRQRLREYGAPAGSVLEYRVGDQKVTVEIS
jgi:hypothetical protein